MLRPPRFRGKSLLTGDWEYGAFVKFKSADGEIHTAIIPEGDDGDHLLNEIISVYPETVGQDIIIRDSKGKDAYVGDIVKDEKNRLWAIYQGPGGFGLSTIASHGENRVTFYKALGCPEGATWFAQNAEIVDDIHAGPKKHN